MSCGISVLGELERRTKDIFSDMRSSYEGSELQKRGFYFFEYARKYWIYHLSNPIPELEGPTWQLFCRCVEGDDITTYKPWDLEQESLRHVDSAAHAIEWALGHEHFALLLCCAKQGSHSLDHSTNSLVLESLIRHGSYQLAEYVIEHGTNHSELLHDGLVYACEEGCNDLVACLLPRVTDINAPCSNRKLTALQAAAAGGHLTVVERLLSQHANVNAPATRLKGLTALQAAAAGGHLMVAERLLAENADVNAPAGSSSGMRALQAAAAGGHLAVVERLLAENADINAPAGGIGGLTALQRAAAGGHLMVVKRLLAANADVNASGGDIWGRKALDLAEEKGHNEVVEYLKQAGCST